jgi:hypothetical protein
MGIEARIVSDYMGRTNDVSIVGTIQQKDIWDMPNAPSYRRWKPNGDIV